MRSAAKSLRDLVARAVLTGPAARPAVAGLGARAVLAAVAARATVAVLAAGLIVGLAAGLTGCSVDLEGATCRVVGAVDNCPSGQACGTDRKCSVKAAGCVPCDAASSARCRAGSIDVETCSATSNPACGRWTVETPCEAGLQRCQLPLAGGAPACACERWTVVPGGSAQACTSPSITGAITGALEFPAPIVRLGGAPPAVYGNELVDAAPLIIPSGVTVIGDETAPVAAPLNRIIEVRASAAAPNTLAALVVEAGASLRGVTVRRFDPSAPAVGILLDGSSPAGGNSLVAVRVDVGPTPVPFGVGLSIAGGNAVTSDVAVSNVHVEGATVTGLEVSRYAAGHVVRVTGSTFDKNQVGVNLLKGDLTLAGTVVKRSVAEGVVAATGTPGQIALTLADDLISWNGTAGLALSNSARLDIQRTQICGNTGSDRGPTSPQRKVGGIFAVGSSPAALTFRGNRVHLNGGDQVYVLSGGPWNLSGAVGCAVADRNVFADYTAPGVGVAAVGASTVDVQNNYWGNPLEQPIGGTDFLGTNGGSVVAGGTGTGYCLHDPPADLTCPVP
jgi:hypothetical protein